MRLLYAVTVLDSSMRAGDIGPGCDWLKIVVGLGKRTLLSQDVVPAMARERLSLAKEVCGGRGFWCMSACVVGVCVVLWTVGSKGGYSAPQGTVCVKACWPKVWSPLWVGSTQHSDRAGQATCLSQIVSPAMARERLSLAQEVG